MSRVTQTVSCLHKSPGSDQMDVVSNDNKMVVEEEISSPDELKENDAPEMASDKKTDELITPEKPRNIVWRLSSGLFNTATGAVGMGVGGIKWVAGKGYDATTAVGSAVITTTTTVVKKVPVPTLRRKDKKE